MKKSLFVFIITLSVTLLRAQTTMTIDASKPGADISKDLYGVFFEEINHAVEGGLYAELIRNRGFEENRMPEGMTREGDFLHTPKGWKHRYAEPASLAGWSLSVSGKADAAISQVSVNPLNSATPNSLQLDVKAVKAGSVSVINSGFWGIEIEKGKTYDLSFYAHCDPSFKGELEVRLEGPDGSTLGKAKIKGIGAEWKKYSCSITATGGNPKGRFCISPLSTGTVWFDVVSLFPKDTYKNRPNGLRKDIAGLIEEFKPGFLRFPGGCIVEGATLENRLKWYNTIGDVAERPGHWVLWDYQASDGVGFHEYLQFCEDLGAAPMYVIPVGMSCQFRKCEVVHIDELQPYIDEVLNALEYAMGPATSKWGAMRAKNGHPEPFKIKYLEIGNENYGPVYFEHYNIFYKAIKAKYPHLNTITCTDPGMRDGFKRSDLYGITEPIEMIDEHFYESPDFFYKNFTRYDSYDRKGPLIYAGEYAVKKWENTLKGNLDASLAEAAFMVGMERNADIVKLSSMAPTFINLNDPTWNPDILAYDNANAYGNPAYHVQKLFATNLADKTLNITSNYPNNVSKPVEKGVGMLGLQNSDLQAEYKDISVIVNGKKYEGDKLFPAEVLAKAKDGIWTGNNDYLAMPFLKSVYDEAGTDDWNDYTLNLKAKANSIDDLECFDVLFYTTGESKHYNWNVSRWRRYSWLQWYDNGYESYFGQQAGFIEQGNWYDITISIKGDSVLCYLDKELVHKVAMPRKIVPGLYSSAGETKTGEIIVKVVNATNDPQPTAMKISGGGTLDPTGKASVIYNNDRFAGNSLEKPENVSIVTTAVTGVSNNFTYTFKPHSVTVLTLKKQ
ncbi:MAG: alpha-L-arabinofuranosidase C-terminal domain-containing protein [Bacteroidales bacterium]|nr:alpha-L-arabinofuranosidase C-terminal domain-containing protein [Bacteroidales bacterium]